MMMENYALFSAWVLYTNQTAAHSKTACFREIRGEESGGRCTRGFRQIPPFALNKLCNDLFLLVANRLRALLLAAHILFVMVVVSGCEPQLVPFKLNTGVSTRFAFLKLPQLRQHA